MTTTELNIGDIIEDEIGRFGTVLEKSRTTLKIKFKYSKQMLVFKPKTELELLKIKRILKQDEVFKLSLSVKCGSIAI